MRRAPPSTKSFTIGRARFKQISAVEGLSLTYDAGREFDEDEAHGLTPEERRRRILEKYGRTS
ncbi:hypothetical protein [Sphingopyxis sp.]|jgi:hypothetical protein|uniref:hypothetical protein n=1 Tax=Sphingopyxis sp. TaxID=1908224 RepID=UPI003F6F03A7